MQHSEFVQLANVCDDEGPAAHAELILSTIMAKSEDKQEAFLQEIQGIHPELYSFILEHTDVAKCMYYLEIGYTKLLFFSKCRKSLWVITAYKFSLFVYLRH